jgi:lipopolysaccharide transport system ATP-binding protein
MQRPIIEVKDLSKAYRLGVIGATRLKDELGRLWDRFRGRYETRPKAEFWALRKVSFQVQRGEVIGVIGRNGAGKSTLLKILSRVTRQTAGEVVLRGRVASLLEVGTGFHPDLTGRENTFLNGAILGMTRAEIKKKFDEIVAFAEIESFIDTPVKRYSSGMYVRLAFAVAAHLEPDILLVDEVLAVGDTQFRKKCLGKMSGISAGNGRTILFVSHSLAAVSVLCSRAILLDHGGLICDGPADQVIAHYLEKSGGESGDVRWGADAAPCSEEFGFAFRRAWVENHRGTVSSSLAQDQPFTICVEYRLERHLPGLLIGFFMQNGKGVGICGSNDVGIPRASDRVAGLYVSRCHFPARILNEDTYHVQFGADDYSSKSAQHLCLRTPFSLSFSVDDLEGHDGGRYKLPGVVRPPLEWHIQSVNGNAINTEASNPK